MNKMLFIDTETTGLDARRHGIIQFAAILEIDGLEVDRFEIKICPHHSCEIEASALEVSGFTLVQVQEFTPERDAFAAVTRWLGKHISKCDKNDKAIFAGYNSPFDVEFVRALFVRNGDNFFGSWFWSGSVDVMGFALFALRNERPEFPNFKLGTLAEIILGPNRLAELTQKNGLHNALTDIEVTRELFIALLGRPA